MSKHRLHSAQAGRLKNNADSVLQTACSNDCGGNDLRVAFTRCSASRLRPYGANDLRVAQTRKNGFTLVEILVALAIIAIAMAALIKASGNHTYSASYLKEKTLAHYVAMNELEKLRLEKNWPDIGTEKKSTEMADHEWYWTREIEKMMDPLTGKPTDQFIQVSFSVYSDEDRKHKLAGEISYLSRIGAATGGTPPPQNGQGN